MATLASRSAGPLPLADSPLGRTIATTATDIWNDSCAVDELEYAISYGAVGATANPTIVTDVWKGDPAHWRGRVRGPRRRAPERHRGRPGVGHRRGDVAPGGAAPAARVRGVRRPPGPALDADRPDASSARTTGCSSRGSRFDGLAPNIIVKFPATSVGVRVMEEATYRGVNVNATVSFSVAQAVAAAEAVERGLRRREAEGLPIDGMGPVITLMMGRLEDWLRVQTERDGIVADPTVLPWSGVAVFKRAYAEFGARGLRARLLGAAIRHHLHWSELIGGRRGHHDAGGLAAPLQRVVDRGPAADGRAGRAGHRRRAPDALPRFRAGLRARRLEPRGVRHVRTDGADPARVHRLVPRPAAPGRRCAGPEPRRAPGFMTEPGIHPSAPPNDLPPDRLAAPARRLGRGLGRSGGGRLALPVVPDRGRWRPGESVAIGGPDHETAVVLVSGPTRWSRPTGASRSSSRVGHRCSTVCPRRSTCRPADRATVAGNGDAASGPTRLAIATAPTRPEVSAALRPVHIRPADIRVEIRGAGHSTRQINHIIAPDFPADRLLLVEVLTPAGNWSSWPPHKHDVDAMPDEAVLEEIYHYRFRRPEAWAIQRVYRAAPSPLGAPRDAVWAVRDGEVVVVTDGYHPFAATDADDAYYLNALAGDRRTMACSFDPALDHVRSRWSGETPDPRLPLVGRAG